jgi:hypothetical protein
MQNLTHIEKDISLVYDTTGESIMSTIHHMLMDEVDVEDKPILHAIERTMKMIPTGHYYWNPTTTSV